MVRGLQVFLLVPVLLAIASCQSPAPQSISFRQLQSISLSLLRQAIYVEAAITYQGLTTPLQSSEFRGCLDWRKRNWRLISGADAFYSDALRQRVVELNDGLYSPDAQQYYENELEAASRAIGRIARRQGSGAICTPEHLSDLAAAELAAVEEQLLNYTAERSAQLEFGSRVPSLARHADFEVWPGRSFFQLQRRARTANCPQPDLHTLENQWPTERYLVICPDENWLVTCEWGECR